MVAVEENLFTWRDVEARSNRDRFYVVSGHLPDEQLMQYLELMRETFAQVPELGERYCDFSADRSLDSAEQRRCYGTITTATPYRHPRVVA